MITRRLLLPLAVALVSVAALPAVAQDWPNKSVTLVMPYPAGGAMDVFVRAIAQKLTERWKQTVVVDNRTGGTEVIAASSVVRAKPDGYTLYMATEVGLETNPFLFSKLPYNPLTDFTPITRIVEGSLVYVVKADSTVLTMQDLIQKAKEQPGKVAYGSTGAGGMVHLSINSLAMASGNTPFMHVPYRGAAPAMQDVLGGTVEFTAVPPAMVVPYVKDKRLRAIATTGAERVRSLPDVPTLRELGFRDFVDTYYFAVVGPAKMPPAVTDKIASDIAAVVRDPEFRAQYVDPYAYVIAVETPADFARHLATNQEKMRERVKSANVKLD